MTIRERLFNTIKFKKVDRFSYRFGVPRKSTYFAWHLQGLPKELEGDDFLRWVGYDIEPKDAPKIFVDFEAVPKFEVKILEIIGDKKIWIDEFGVKRIDHIKPPTEGFVTRRYLEFPVKNKQDFKEIIKRFNPDSPERLSYNFEENCEKLKDRTWDIGLTIPGLFWKPRDWLGFENLCMKYVEDPDLVHNMIDFWTEFIIKLISRVLTKINIDYIFLNEDMAYKTALMISPRMCEEFLVPGWKKIIKYAKSNGVSMVWFDCDGCVTELIPILIECGFDAIWPIEIAANNDPIEYREKYGNNIALMGCIDKRKLTKSKKEVKEEVLSKVPFLSKGGGFIPGVDHGVPPDVKLRNYLYMVELIKAIAEGRDPDKIEKSPLEDELKPIVEEWHPGMVCRDDE